jgi:ribulose 1,5-bisphosphate synthetase/thiazole synthase
MFPKYSLIGKTHVRQLEGQIPIEGHFDVIVAGAGVAGVSAAVSAARLGARTLLVERNGYPGGVTTGGLSGVIWGPCGISGMNY